MGDFYKMAQSAFKIKWKGGFEQFGQENEVEFSNMYMDLNGNIYGDGSDAVGNFTISGVWGDNVQFTKQYIGAHAVQYSGTTEDGKKVTGRWEIPGNCDGTFWLKVKEWKGWYKQGGDKNDMDLDMQVSPEGVFGLGMDVVGKFVIRGYYDPNQSCVSFVKQYIGQHAVHYNGSMYLKDDGEKHTIKGVWNIPNQCHGYFKLKEHYD